MGDLTKKKKGSPWVTYPRKGLIAVGDLPKKGRNDLIITDNLLKKKKGSYYNRWPTQVEKESLTRMTW